MPHTVETAARNAHTSRNADIPSGQEVRAALKNLPHLHKDFVVTNNFDLRYIPTYRFLEMLQLEKKAPPRLINWLRELLRERSDIGPILFSPQPGGPEKPALFFTSDTPDHAAMILVLDCDSEPSKKYAEFNDWLLTKAGRLRNAFFTLQVSDLLYVWPEEHVSVRSLQLEELRQHSIFVSIANFLPTVLSRYIWELMVNTGATDGKELYLTERHDEIGRDITLHETGHQIAMHLGLDKFSKEQSSQRLANNRNQPLPIKTTKPLALVYQEISYSERLANIIGRMLRKRAIPAKYNSVTFKSAFLEKRLESYDASAIVGLHRNQLPDKELKSVLAARVNRTHHGLKQARETYGVQNALFADFQHVLSRMGEPVETKHLLSGNRLTQKVWFFHDTELTQYKVTTFERRHKVTKILVEVTSETQLRKYFFEDGKGIRVISADEGYDKIVNRLYVGEYNQNQEEVVESLQTEAYVLLAKLAGLIDKRNPEKKYGTL